MSLQWHNPHKKIVVSIQLRFPQINHPSNRNRLYDLKPQCFQIRSDEYFGWVYTDITSAMLYDVTASTLPDLTCTQRSNTLLASQPAFLQENTHSLQYHFLVWLYSKTLIPSCMQLSLLSGVNTNITFCICTGVTTSVSLLFTWILKILNTHNFSSWPGFPLTNFRRASSATI
jgi:hypothetical protein